VRVPLVLSNPSTQVVRAQWHTLPVPGLPHPQGEPGFDYVASSGTATFLPGQISTTISVEVLDDPLVEEDEIVVVSFHHPTNAVMGGFWGLGFAVIQDNDDDAP
jgi:hypothetical protein